MILYFFINFQFYEYTTLPCPKCACLLCITILIYNELATDCTTKQFKKERIVNNMQEREYIFTIVVKTGSLQNTAEVAYLQVSNFVRS